MLMEHKQIVSKNTGNKNWCAAVNERAMEPKVHYENDNLTEVRN